MDTRLKVLVYGVLLFLWLLPYWRLIRFFARWADRRPLFALETAFLLLVMFGVLGRDYGLPELFWHDHLAEKLLAGFCALAFLGFIWALSFITEPGDAPRMHVRWQPPVGPSSAPETSSVSREECGALARPVEPPFGLESWTESDDQIFGFLDALSRSRLARPLRRGREALRRPQVAESSDRGRYGFELAGPVLEAVARRGTPLFWMQTKLVVVLIFFLGLVTIPAVVSTLDRIAIRVRGIPVGSVWADLWLPAGAALALVGVAGLVWLLDKSTYRSHRPLAQPPRTSTESQPATTGPDWGVQFPKTGTGSGKAHTITIPRIRSKPGFSLDARRRLHGLAAGVILVYLLGTFGLQGGERMPGAAAICTLLGIVAAFSGLTFGRPILRAVLIVVLLALVAWNNGRDPYKLSYPCLEVRPDRSNLVVYDPASAIERWQSLRARGTSEPETSGPAPGLLDDRRVLNAWLAAHPPEAGKKPKLVVVAVSGGGIAAALWTALNLQRLEASDPRFPGLVRVITGASGGMLGAGYYTATLRGPGGHTRGDLARLVPDLARDSLTPVVNHLVFRDLPAILLPGRQADDRGRVLERTWERHTRGPGVAPSPLARPFRDLARGEAEGWRPSLIVSPMLVEDVAPLLISNLDLDPLRAVEFFKLFAAAPGLRAGDLKLSTAVRMNAAFPLVTPATCLPTRPPRRVVDAGYYDNYGIVTATAWIAHHRPWLAAHTSGVLLIQIRAYPPLADGPGAAPLQALWDGMQWLTTPIQGYTSASKHAMIDRNGRLIAALRTSFPAEAPFDAFVLECPEAAPLSWYITQRDLEAMIAASTRVYALASLREQHANRTEIDFTDHYYCNLIRIKLKLGCPLDDDDRAWIARSGWTPESGGSSLRGRPMRGAGGPRRPDPPDHT